MKFIFFLIIIFLIKECKEEFNLIKRIEGAVKIMLSSLENAPNYYSKSFTLKYSKYKINFNRFRLVSPIIDNISIYENDINSQIFTFENITFGFVFDITIYFNSNSELLKKDNYLDSTFSSIKFKYNKSEDYLNFDTFGDINSPLNLIKTNFDIDILDYFRQFKERKLCYCKIDNEEYKLKDPNILILNFLQDIIKYYISKIENYNILLTYDLYSILNNTIKKYECSKDTKNKYKIEYIKINKILIPSDKIKVRNEFKNRIEVYQIKYIGYYYSSNYKKEIDFSFGLDEDQEQVITLINKKLNFILEDLDYDCIFCKEHIQEIEALKYAIKNDYGKILTESIYNYYN